MYYTNAQARVERQAATDVQRVVRGHRVRLWSVFFMLSYRDAYGLYFDAVLSGVLFILNEHTMLVVRGWSPRVPLWSVFFTFRTRTRTSVSPACHLSGGL